MFVKQTIQVGAEGDLFVHIEHGMRNLIKEYNITSTRSRFYEKPDIFADYILVSLEVIVENFNVLNEEISDHLPLLVEFR